ncbi:MAG: hypothetical protein KJ666_11285 [Bacteroidetes bacterium]|nr:hypothetical protein [Bacteroidota bacterium]
MKSRIAVSMVALLAIAFLVGCVTVSKVTEKASSPLARILVYVGDVPLGESGRNAEGTEINRGGTIVFTAQGRDGNGNPIAISPSWTPTKPGIVEIIPAEGSRVTLRGIAEGTIDIVVEAAGVKRTLQLIAVR